MEERRAVGRLMLFFAIVFVVEGIGQARVGILMGFAENNPNAKGWLARFVEVLADLGWTRGPQLAVGRR